MAFNVRLNPPSEESAKSFSGRRKAMKEGVCIWCRNPDKKPEPGRKRCDDCIIKDRNRKRKANKGKPWEPGKKGRPPLVN